MGGKLDEKMISKFLEELGEIAWKKAKDSEKYKEENPKTYC